MIHPGPGGRSGGCGAAALPPRLEGAGVGRAGDCEADSSPARPAAKPRAGLGARSSELGGRPRRFPGGGGERRPGERPGGVTGRGDGAGQVKRRAPPQERGATRTPAGGLPVMRGDCRTPADPPAASALARRGCQSGGFCRSSAVRMGSGSPAPLAASASVSRLAPDRMEQLPQGHSRGSSLIASSAPPAPLGGRLGLIARKSAGSLPCARRGRSSRAVALCVGCERGFWARSELGPGAAVLSEVSVCPQRPLQCVPCKGPEHILVPARPGGPSACLSSALPSRLCCLGRWP